MSWDYRFLEQGVNSDAKIENDFVIGFGLWWYKGSAFVFQDSVSMYLVIDLYDEKKGYLLI